MLLFSQGLYLQKHLTANLLGSEYLLVGQANSGDMASNCNGRSWHLSLRKRASSEYDSDEGVVPGMLKKAGALGLLRTWKDGFKLEHLLSLEGSSCGPSRL